MNKLKGWKTLIFNGVMGMVAFAQVYSGEDPNPGPIMEALQGLEGAVVALWGIGNVVLRAVTNTAVFQKD